MILKSVRDVVAHVQARGILNRSDPDVLDEEVWGQKGHVSPPSV